MEIQIITIEQATVVDLAGDIDGKTAPIAQEQIVPLIREGSNLLLEMTKVSYMSSAGLRMLLSVYRQASANKARIALVGLSEEIKDTMAVTGFLNYFTTCATLEAGLEALSA
jgi:anti-sigma B factor antagonist